MKQLVVYLHLWQNLWGTHRTPRTFDCDEALTWLEQVTAQQTIQVIQTQHGPPVPSETINRPRFPFRNQPVRTRLVRGKLKSRGLSRTDRTNFSTSLLGSAKGVLHSKVSAFRLIQTPCFVNWTYSVCNMLVVKGSFLFWVPIAGGLWNSLVDDYAWHEIAT